jgi:SAM-dependent methyltransferase
MHGTLHNGERQVAPELSGIRRDHVARYEFAAGLIGSGKRVIDLACGIGYGSSILADAGNEVLAIDRSGEAIVYGKAHYARDGLQFECLDADELDLGVKHFDAAVCFETIEHIADPLPMLKELRRVAPLLIASVPNEAVFPHLGQVKFHYRHYTREEFNALLASAGFEVTGWRGQEGPYSEVEADIEGRTLIAVARRADVAPEMVEPPVPAIVRRPAPTIEKAPDHVAIVGLGPSGRTFFELVRGQGGASAWCDEVWGINAIGDTFRCDRIFHMDDVALQERRAFARPSSNIANMVRWLKTHPGPIYTSVVREGYPGMVEFPLEDVLNRKHDGNGGAPYFNSTTAYAIAYAVHIGVKTISLWGVDYTLPNVHHGEQGRACVEFWLGIAAARGIEIIIPDTSTLMDACAPARERIYGYDGVDVVLKDQPDGTVKVEFKERELPTAAEIEARYDHSKHPNRLMQKD